MFAYPQVDFKSMKFISVIPTAIQEASSKHIFRGLRTSGANSPPVTGNRKIRDSREVRPAATKGGSLPASKP
jgi:hypothetical protein